MFEIVLSFTNFLHLLHFLWVLVERRDFDENIFLVGEKRSLASSIKYFALKKKEFLVTPQGAQVTGNHL